jgi:hypothetical protein
MTTLTTYTPTAPEVNEETAPFWQAANEERLILRRCKTTGKAFHPPRTFSPFTGLAQTDWIEASGKGIVYSFSVSSRRGPPHCIAYVTLEEGPTLLSNLIDCDPEAVAIGQAVRVVFIASASGQRVPMFTPVA